MRTLTAFAFAFLTFSQGYALNMAFSSADLQGQEKQYASKIDGEDALTTALLVILDDDQANESPFSIAGSEEKLLTALRADGSQLYLVTKGDEDHKPQWGEDVSQNWIFCLYLPTVSDHLYWVVIDRSGERAPYVYGFN